MTMTAGPFPDPERFKWFEAHARRIVERCRRMTPLPGISDEPMGIYVPGGDDKYPSFWVRDYVMQCRSGFVDAAEMKMSLRFFLSHQNGAEKRDLANGLRIDPWSIPDHINVPGVGNPDFHRAYADGAVYFPGSYSPTDNQGHGRFGHRPADDDIYEVVDLVRQIVESVGADRSADVLLQEVGGVSIGDRLHFGITAMTVDEQTGLCWNNPADWSASSFHDSLRPMGAIAFTSVLRFRAARQMAELCRLAQNSERMRFYQDLANRLAREVVAKLRLPSGWLMAGSVVNRQPDIWSTSMAVYYGLLRGDHALAACEAMLRAYRDGSVARSGYLRHTPTRADAAPGKTVWEDQLSQESSYGSYQSGGYWPQPVGYYAYALAQVDKDAATQIAREFIDHTRARVEAGAPFEWINPELSHEDGKWYGPSAALPLEGFRRLGTESHFPL